MTCTEDWEDGHEQTAALTVRDDGPGLGAFAADPPQKAPATDAFLSDVAVGNRFEIDSSQVALAKSKSEPVRNFATRMVVDHIEAGVKFTKAMNEAKLEAPSETQDVKHKAILDDLTKMDGAAFDQAYVQAQQKAHTETVQLFEVYATGGDNAQMKKFAQEVLPTHRAHMQHVNKLP